jgi:phosphoribosylformylglycinamidine cyclo-ligase
MPGVTYKASGVDIDRANAFVDGIRALARGTRRPGVLGAIGGFGGFFRMNSARGYRDPVLVSSADGVGTKLKCAQIARRYEGLGVDLVAMNVNDVLVSGAEPLFFLDYLAVGKLEPAVLREVLRGVARGCRESACALIGGETAEMPGVYRPGDFDLAGFAVGVVERRKIIGGDRIRPGDAVVGCASTGFHSNGFSFVRKVLPPAFIRAHAAEVLRPTRIYVRPVLRLLRRAEVRGMAHITGGGFYDKLGRILPRGLGAEVRAGSWPVPRVFRWVEERARPGAREMFRTFNMGIGYAIVVPPRSAVKVARFMDREGVPSWVIGRITREPGVRIC